MEDGKLWKKITGVKLSSDFSGFQVDAFNVSSYSGKGSESSLLAVGRLDDFSISVGSSFSDFFDFKIIDGQWKVRSSFPGLKIYYIFGSSSCRHAIARRGRAGELG